jgi:hypothetical protein
MIYTVQRGDTLSIIAAKLLDPSLGLSYKDIAGWNGIADPNRITIGQKLDIPDSVLRQEIIFEGQTVPGLVSASMPTAGQPDAIIPTGSRSSGFPAQQAPAENLIFGIPAKWVMIGGAALLAVLVFSGRK